MNEVDTENLINRIRQMLAFGMTKDEIALQLHRDFEQHEIYHAYKAATILERDMLTNYSGPTTI